MFQFGAYVPGRSGISKSSYSPPPINGVSLDFPTLRALPEPALLGLIRSKLREASEMMAELDRRNQTKRHSDRVNLRLNKARTACEIAGELVLTGSGTAEAISSAINQTGAAPEAVEALWPDHWRHRKNTAKEARNALMLRMKRRGASAKTIGERVGLHPKSVERILRSLL